MHITLYIHTSIRICHAMQSVSHPVNTCSKSPVLLTSFLLTPTLSTCFIKLTSSQVRLFWVKQRLKPELVRAESEVNVTRM